MYGDGHLPVVGSRLPDDAKRAEHGALLRCNLMNAQVIGVNNPGTPESALIDMRLLSECNELVVTVGSSYGSIASGIGGIAPVQMIHGKHENVQVCQTSLCRSKGHCEQSWPHYRLSGGLRHGKSI